MPKSQLIKEYELNGMDIIFYIKNIKNPKLYGVASISKTLTNVYQINNVEEKPKCNNANLYFQSKNFSNSF